MVRAKRVYVQDSHCTRFHTHSEEHSVKFLNFGTAENFAVIYLKFKQTDQTLEYFFKKI